MRAPAHVRVYSRGGVHEELRKARAYTCISKDLSPVAWPLRELTHNGVYFVPGWGDNALP